MSRVNCFSGDGGAHRSKIEIWCGESHGSIAIFTLTDDAVVTSQALINHHEPVLEDVEVLQVVSNKVSLNLCKHYGEVTKPDKSYPDFIQQLKKQIVSKIL